MNQQIYDEMHVQMYVQMTDVRTDILYWQLDKYVLLSNMILKINVLLPSFWILSRWPRFNWYLRVSLHVTFCIHLFHIDEECDVTLAPMGEIMYLSTAVLTVIDWITEIKEGRELNGSVIEGEVDLIEREREKDEDRERERGRMERERESEWKRD